MMLPQKRKIILGVTGGIAAYKSCELVRLLKKSGHEVRVILTKNAEKFVGALSFESLSGNPVLRDGESSCTACHNESLPSLALRRLNFDTSNPRRRIFSAFSRA